MTDEILGRIENKLDVLIRLLAYRLVEGKQKTEAIVALGNLGLDRNLIADIVVTTPAAVSARLSEARRAISAGKKVKKGQEADEAIGSR